MSSVDRVEPVSLFDYNLKVPIAGLALQDWDYMSLSVSSATETYTFKFGGSSGTTTNTLTVVYTDSNRSTISTVTKT